MELAADNAGARAPRDAARALQPGHKSETRLIKTARVRAVGLSTRGREGSAKFETHLHRRMTLLGCSLPCGPVPRSFARGFAASAKSNNKRIELSGLASCPPPTVNDVLPLLYIPHGYCLNPSSSHATNPRGGSSARRTK